MDKGSLAGLLALSGVKFPKSKKRSRISEHNCGDCKRLRLKSDDHKYGVCWPWPMVKSSARNAVTDPACEHFDPKD
jgi:hypothetical protein